MNSNTAKQEEMRNNGSFNHRAQAVSAEIFTGSSFFDKHDLMQVKYEMLRSVEQECRDVTSTAGAFGFSRVSFYQIKKEFDENGVSGLMPKKRGPKGSRKLTQSDVEFAQTLTNTHTKTQILTRLKEERGVEVSKRTLERQLSVKKNLRFG
jgi:transposase